MAASSSSSSSGRYRDSEFSDEESVGGSSGLPQRKRARLWDQSWCLCVYIYVCVL